jgi:fructokinase
VEIVFWPLSERLSTDPKITRIIFEDKKTAVKINLSRQPIIFGETFVDCFPDGSFLLGGASFNVAWNLKGLGMDPLFITAVGDDEFGELYRKKMQEWGMRLEGVMTDFKRPTGKCRVFFHASGDAYYTSDKDCAFDYLDELEVLRTVQSNDFFYHSGVIARQPTSRAVLNQIIAQRRPTRFFDVNLRPPDTNLKDSRNYLQRADFVKCNLEEFEQLFELPWKDGVAQSEIEQRVRQYQIGTLWVTRGERSTYCFTGKQYGKVFEAKPSPINAADLKDTVGAGDAFSAAIIYGIYQQWPADRMMEFANHFAARVCTLQGAISEERSFYHF